MEHRTLRFDVGDLVKVRWTNLKFIVLDIKQNEYVLYSPDVKGMMHIKEEFLERVE